jgi:hypothetical protein
LRRFFEGIRALRDGQVDAPKERDLELRDLATERLPDQGRVVVDDVALGRVGDTAEGVLVVLAPGRECPDGC